MRELAVTNDSEKSFPFPARRDTSVHRCVFDPSALPGHARCVIGFAPRPYCVRLPVADIVLHRAFLGSDGARLHCSHQHVLFVSGC